MIFQYLSSYVQYSLQPWLYGIARAQFVKLNYCIKIPVINGSGVLSEIACKWIWFIMNFIFWHYEYLVSINL